MTDYAAPVEDMRFVLDRIVGLDRIAALPGYEDVSADLVDAVLEEAAKLAGEVLAPLNQVGDRERCRYENGVVRMPTGFRAAYDQYRDGGWNGLPFDPDYGGQGLPWAVAFAVQEMWQAANLSFGLCPLLNQGAVELLQSHGTPEQKAAYLPKLISGEWTGTMNLTEPQAGSDLSAVRCRAEPQPDGSYRIRGQKIFITYGEHDLATNIVHMTLARLPDAPPGTRGISLFLVPKFMVGEDGEPGPRNDVRCVSVEHKLGIHASPTCVMSFGDDDGAVGYLVGQENRGLAAMFTMMNNARLSVGLEGVAIADRAYQQARTYAFERVQGQSVGQDGGEPGPIIGHPDVRRMLLTMKASTEAARALTYFAAWQLDLAKRAPTEAARADARALADLLTPVVKAWCTDLGCEVASTGIQVHGGMGFVEETGAAQHLRDARICPIYEGTNGIQAADLVFRKVGRDDGAAALGFIETMADFDMPLSRQSGDDIAVIRLRLAAGVNALREATQWVAATVPSNPVAAAAAAGPYLKMFGMVAGGYMMARAAAEAASMIADGGTVTGFLAGKLATARFYADHFLAQAQGLIVPVTAGHHAVVSLADSQF
ncbi:MAG: acyl-CoA dehydrogenase [Rhodospirillaceae bacterium]|nr:acyl-CoA dehydrogenase [Rhodospirillaceae bacterium]